MTKPLEALISRAKHIVENGGLLARDTSLALIAALEQSQEESKIQLKTIASVTELWNDGRLRIAELEASQLVVKRPEQYPDDSDLSFFIDLYDVGCEENLRFAMWLKELRRRRAGGKVQGGDNG